MEDVRIRQYKIEDRVFVRDIAWDTAFLGDQAGAFFDDKEILAGILTAYFTDYEPESCFTAEAGGNVVGYLMGARSMAVQKKVFMLKIVPRLFMRFILKGAIFRKKNLRFILSVIGSFIKGEFKQPDFSKDYPAVLHINVKEGYRGSGIGARLMAGYMDYLSGKNIKGVQLTSISGKAENFFTRQGFKVLYGCRRSYFRYILGVDISMNLYGKKI